MTEEATIKDTEEMSVPGLDKNSADPVALAGQMIIRMIERMADLQEQGVRVGKTAGTAEFPYDDWIGTLRIELAFRHKSERVQ